MNEASTIPDSSVPNDPNLQPATRLSKESNVTPGIRTTEFWSHAFVIASCVVGAVTGVLPGKAAIIAAGIASGCYAISRALTKLGGNLW